MPANPTSVQEAREALVRAVDFDTSDAVCINGNLALDALILAVRADEGARLRGIVEGMRWAGEPDGAWHNHALEQVIAALSPEAG